MNLTDDQFKAWTKALRSGDFTQGPRFLFIKGEPGSVLSEDHYCCLGVAGKVCLHLPLSKMDNYAFLRNVNMPGESPFTAEEEDVLAALNDNYNLTFTQIAAFLEGASLDLWDQLL